MSITNRLFNLGMSSDNTPRMQPPNTYRYALNAVVESDIGDHGAISNERGNQRVLILLPNETILGHKVLDDNDIILFTNQNRILKHNSILNTLTEIVSDNCFNFKTDEYIQTSFALSGCDRLVFFSSKSTPLRVINIDDPAYYNEIVLGIKRTCDRTLYSPSDYPPCPELSVVNESSLLKNGLYYVAYRYKDKHSNYSAWSLTTKPVVLGVNGNGYKTLATHESYGGSTTLLPRAGDKSIKVRFTGLLGVTYSDIQLAFIERTSDNGSLGEATITYPIAIQQSLPLEYTFTGNKDQVESTTSIDEIVSSKYRPYLNTSHVIHNNRLFVSSSERERDYTNYQRHASKIGIKWIQNNSTTILDSADPIHDQTASLPFDEVIALGISYIHTDGSASPVFHIPGRSINTVTGSNPRIGTAGVGAPAPWDTAPISLGRLFSGGSERWRQISTATDTGVMGYYETNTTYPVIPDCLGNPDGFWGRDINNTLLQNTPIRHHRLPDLQLVNLNPLGISATNITYPPDVVGHHICIADSDGNRTIVDRGLLIRSPTEITAINITPRGYPVAFSQPNYLFLSSAMLLEDRYIDGDYIHLDYFVKDLAPAASNPSRTNAGITVDYQLRMLKMDQKTSLLNVGTTNYNIETSLILPKSNLGSQNVSTVTLNGSVFENKSVNTTYNLLRLSSLLSDFTVDTTLDTFPIVSKKLDRVVYSNLSNLSYYNLNTCVDRSSSASDLFNYYGGDVFISLVNITDYSFDFSSSPFKINGYTISYKIPDMINRYPLRSKGAEPKYSVFNNNYSYDLSSFTSYLQNKMYALNSTDYSMYTEYYDYNKSYSFINRLGFLYPLAYNFDYCDTCDPTKAFRVYYSELNNREDSVNSLFVIRPNNYVSLDEYVTRLFVNANDLHAITPNSLWKLPTRQETLLSTDSIIYLGRANVIGQPYRYNPTSISFSGATSPTSLCETEFGTVYMDDVSSRLFLISNALNDLSKSHLRNFFQNNGKLECLKYFPTYKSVQFVGANGAGFMTSYDPRYKRLILTKRDFIPRDSNAVTYNGTNFLVNGVIVSPYNPLYFQDKSFTISYSFLTNAWISFHSYIPLYQYSSRQDHFMAFNSAVFLSSRGKYQFFFNKKYDHILDIVSPNTSNEKMNYLMLSGKAYENKLEVDSTFDRWIIYNSHQVTPLASLGPKTPLDWDSSYTNVEVVKVDNLYRISNIRDYSKDYITPIWINSTEPSVDKVLNPLRINLTKSLFELERLSDLYTGVRLYYNPINNIQLVTDMISLNTSSKIR